MKKLIPVFQEKAEEMSALINRKLNGTPSGIIEGM